MYPKKLRQTVLSDYQTCENTIPQLAKKHHISRYTIMAWRRKAALLRRTRGQRRQAQPSPRTRRIADLAKIYKYEVVGEMFGITKQAVCRIVKRWGHV